MVHVESNNLGVVLAEAGFIIARDPDTVRAPDAAFISQERIKAGGDVPGYFPGAPDLVVKIISPSDIYGDVEEKVRGWLGAGARMVLVVNPRHRTVTLYHKDGRVIFLTERDELSGGEVVPGWTMPVRDLFV